MHRSSKAQVYVLLAPGFEESDVTTVTRTLRRAGLAVALVGLTAGPIRGCYGMSLAADKTLSEAQAELARAIVLPGGSQGARQMNADPRVHTLLCRVIEQGGFLLALDTGYMVLHTAGVLNRAGNEAIPIKSSTWREDSLASGRVVVDGQVIFGRDSGVAQESALALAARLDSEAWPK